MSNGTYSAKQRAVLQNANARWNILSGAVRSGKTFVSYDLLMLRLMSLPDGNRMIIGKTERTLKRNVLDPLRRRFIHVSKINNDGVVNIMGKDFYVAGANDEASKTKIQGIGLIYAYGDEITTWNENFFQMLKSRLDKPGAKFDGTCNPEGPYHWLKKDMLDKPGIDLYHAQFKLDDNPFLSRAFRNSLKIEYTGVWYNRMIEGAWCMAEGAIYDGFDTKKHTITDEVDIYEYDWLTIDYGTANPCVFLHMRTVGKQTFCLHEYYWDSRKEMRQKTDEDYLRDLQAFIQTSNARRLAGIFVDPSALSFITLLKRNNYQVMKVDNTVVEGIKSVSSALSNGSYFIHTRCTHLIEEKSAYVWDKAAQDIGEDKPLKENDHCSDAERYLIYTRHKAGAKLGVITVQSR